MSMSQPEPKRPSPSSVLGVTSLAVFAASLDATILFVAFPDIQSTFSTVSAEQLSWVLNAYTIVLAVTLAIWVSVNVAYAAKRRSLGVRVGVGMAAWLALTLYLSHRNFIFAEATPVYFVLFPLLIPILGGALLLSQPEFRQLVAAIPQTMLIAPHMLRIIGFNFIILSELGYLPAGFALPAGYGDVITALAVPFVLYLFVTGHSRARQAILGWNVLGLADFVVALTTGPLFIQPYLLTTQQPYDLNYFTMIPIFAVPIFLLTHLTHASDTPAAKMVDEET